MSISRNCDTVVSEDPSLISYCSDKYMTQEMCDRAVSEDPFFIPDKCITQKICDKAVYYSLAALKLVPDWFVTRKMIKKVFAALYTDKNIPYFNEDSSNVVFICNGMAILKIDINNISLDNNFGEDDPDTIILIRLLAWYTKFEKRKALTKKDKRRINANSLASL